MYESVLSLRSSSTGAEGVLALSRSLCLSLPLGEDKLMSGAVVVLDEAHVAVVGFPHPSAGACKGDSSSSNQIIHSLHKGCASLLQTVYILIVVLTIYRL